ncbi:amidase [Paenibacillus yonginensis]|uniref:amidase n=1 Tax=Paenibacillus yonginensis TaxID=1462996 RepID=UPI000837EF84|nr:amidase [Paenibacillus yonginensis]
MNMDHADQWNAYIQKDLNIQPQSGGRLEGLSFAVKDVFAVKGHRNAAGNPAWLRTHDPSGYTAPVIEALLGSGAALKGMTHTDELMYSLSGENVHYGTPVNPAAPDRIPGGSSSGSAAAVAAGLSDFALGTDTGGSVRIPSSYCGIYGFRPTHGRISVHGVIPLAHSFDTVGWMSRNPDVLRRVGEVLGAPQPNLGLPFLEVHLPSDAWSLLDSAASRVLRSLIPAVEQAAAAGRWGRLADAGLPDWARIFRTIQGFEIAEEHGGWIAEYKPVFGPDIAGRFAWARTISREQAEACRTERSSIQSNLMQLLGRDGLLVIPTAPGGAPRTGAKGEAAENVRSKVMQLTSIAGLSGFPQVTLPVARIDGLPLGLSILSAPDQDGRLLNWVEKQLVPAIEPLTSLEGPAKMGRSQAEPGCASDRRHLGEGR